MHLNAACKDTLLCRNNLKIKYRFDVIIPIRSAGSTNSESSHYAAFSIYSLLPLFGAQVDKTFLSI
jgi:hypothetical protein